MKRLLWLFLRLGLTIIIVINHVSQPTGRVLIVNL